MFRTSYGLSRDHIHLAEDPPAVQA